MKLNLSRKWFEERIPLEEGEIGAGTIKNMRLIKCRVTDIGLRRAIATFAETNKFEAKTRSDAGEWIAIDLRERHVYCVGSVLNEQFSEVTVSEIFKTLETPPPVIEIDRIMLSDWGRVIFFSNGSFRIENFQNGIGLTLERDEISRAITRYEAINP